MSNSANAGGYESPLPAIEQMARWRYVWLKAVTLAWFDDEFKKELIANPRLALHNAFGFEVPAGVDLVVEEACRGDGTSPGWMNGQWELPANEVTMILPCKPDEELQVEAVALSVYAEMGRSHPFTFCL